MKKLELDRMCTSVAIGFYIRNQNEFYAFIEKIKSLSRKENSIFSVYDKKPEKPKSNEVDVQMVDE